MVEGAIAENEFEMSSTSKRIQCRICGSYELRRAFRRGFMQLNIYPLFGYFPWRCRACGTRVMLHKRHSKKQHHAE